MTCRLFVSDNLIENAKIALNEQQSHYLMHVMRIRISEHVLLFNGLNGEWEASVSEISKKQVFLTVLKQTRSQDDSNLNVWLCFAPIKKDNMDFVIQKTTELGVDALYPVITTRTIVSKVNTERMQLQAIEASEQSERLSVPEIKKEEKFDKFLQNWDKSRTLYYLTERQDVPEIKTFSDKSAFLIGPEGGFEEKELKKLEDLPYTKPIHLGRRILRAETAAIAAMVMWNVWSGWK